MGGKKKQNCIGIEFTTNEGYQVVVVDYINTNKVIIMFLDEHRHKMPVTWQNVKNGRVRNPFHRSIFGVGYLGTDSNGKVPNTTKKGKNRSVSTREYNVWYRMMVRCYDEKHHERKPTYKNVTVCDRWHCFANFLEDLPKIMNYEYWKSHPNEYVALNKDIYYAELGIETDCKEYSLLTTRFIDNGENVLEMIDRHGTGTPPVKVRYIKPVPYTGIDKPYQGKIYESMSQASRETGDSTGKIWSHCNGKVDKEQEWEYVD